MGENLLECSHTTQVKIALNAVIELKRAYLLVFIYAASVDTKNSEM